MRKRFVVPVLREESTLGRMTLGGVCVISTPCET